MSETDSWYIRGEHNQPAGPFTAEQIIQFWRAGRLDANTICWREGMSQWLPLIQVESFTSAVAVTMRPPALHAVAPSSPQASGRSASWQNRFWLACIGGGAFLFVTVVVLVLAVGGGGPSDREIQAAVSRYYASSHDFDFITR